MSRFKTRFPRLLLAVAFLAGAVPAAAPAETRPRSETAQVPQKVT